MDHKRRQNGPREQAQWIRARMRAEGDGGLMVGCKVGKQGTLGICLEEYTPVGTKRCPACNGTGRVIFPWPERLTLAAYCGDEEARIAASDRGLRPPPHYASPGGRSELGKVGASICPDNLGFADWISGLSRWPAEVLSRAATAAGKAAHDNCAGCFCQFNSPPGQLGPDPDCRTWQALETADAYHVNPNEKTRRAWERAFHAALVNADNPNRHWIAGPFDDCDQEILTRRIQIAAREIGEGPAREAIQAKLIKWVLCE